MVLALGLVTSTSVLALSHILIALPALYFLKDAPYSKYSMSAWMLLVMSLMIVLSVLFTQDIAMSGYKPIGKVKYFLFGFLMIAPFSYYFKNALTEKKISYLIYAFLIATTVATIAGIVGMKTGYNFISRRVVNMDRNAGLSGMVLNYAHNLAYFQAIAVGLLIHRKRVEKFVNIKILGSLVLVNFIGLYLSYTRGAMLALIIGLPFYFFKRNKLKFVTIASAIIITAGAIYTISGKSFLRPASDRERISQWKAAVMAFKERPIFGYGYLNFERYSVPLKEKYNIGELQFGGHAHNNFLEMLASTGILGFSAFMLWLFSWLWEMYRRQDLIGEIGFPFIITFIVSGLTQSTIALGVNLFFVMAVYAVGQADCFKEKRV